MLGKETIIDPRSYHTVKEGKHGLGPAPITTAHGRLHLADGVRDTAVGMRYMLYMLLCDLNESWILLMAPGDYFIAPDIRKCVRDTSHVFFANGWVSRTHGNVFIYHGAPDTRAHVAISTVDKLLDYVVNTPADGLRSKIRAEQRYRPIDTTLRRKT